MHRARPVVYLTNNGLGEPHVASQVLPYLEGSGHRVHLITCEKPSRDEAATSEARRLLKDLGAAWTPVPFRPPLLGTWRNVRELEAAAVRAVLSEGRAILHARAYVAAEAARRAAARTGSPWIFDMRGFYLEERIDDGRLRRGSLQHRYLLQRERRLLQEADAVVVLSEAGRQALEKGLLGVRPRDVRVIPCAVDLDQFSPGPAARAGPRTLAYSGSIGPGYLSEAMGVVAGALHAQAGWRFNIASRQSAGALASAAVAAGMPSDAVSSVSLRPSQVPGFLQQADAGILLLRSSLAKVASSPIKVGEYLAAGLPVVLSPGCGDASDWVTAEGVGVVVDPTDAASLDEGARRLVALVAEPGIRARCRRVAEKRLSLAAGVAEYARLYDDLGGGS